MKKIFTTVFVLAVFGVFAGEREDLLKKFETEYAVAKKELSENAETTVELVSAAGGCSILSEKHLFQAFDYKLRNTSDARNRLQIIEDFHKLSKEVQTLHLTPREGMGSLAGMWIYHAEANLMRQQLSVWMLNAKDEKRWKRIADTLLLLNGKTIKLDRGRAKFDDVMHDQKVTLEIILFPKDTFTYNGRDFAIIRTDIQFAGNDDYSTVYLCELKNGRLQVYSTLEMPYFTSWKLKGKNTLHILNSDVVQNISL